MPNTQQLREQRANLWENMKEIMDRAEGASRDLTVDEQATYDQLEKDLDAKESDLNRAEKHEDRASRYSKIDRTGVVAPADSEDDEREFSARYQGAFKRYVTLGMAEMSPEDRSALREGFVKPEKGDRAAAGVATGGAGGYLVPEGFRKQIVETMKDFGSVQSVRPGHQHLHRRHPPLADERRHRQRRRAARGEHRGHRAGPHLRHRRPRRVQVHVEARSRLLEFLQDVDWLDAEAFISRKFAERLGRIHNQHFTTGTGSSQPEGIVTGATSGVTAASATAFTADELIDLQHSVDPAYRNERSRYML